MNHLKFIALPEPILQLALNYLSKQPWAEVDNLMNELQSSLIKLEEGDTYENVIEEYKRIRTRTLNKSSAPE